MAKKLEWGGRADGRQQAERAGWRVVVGPMPRTGWDAVLYDADLADAAIARGEKPEDEDAKFAGTEADAKQVAEEMLERQIKSGPPASRFRKQ